MAESDTSTHAEAGDEKFDNLPLDEQLFSYGRLARNYSQGRLLPENHHRNDFLNKYTCVFGS